MGGVIARPEIHVAPQGGLLRADQFQIAYATNDMDRACALFGERLGIREFRRLEGILPEGGHIRVELAWVGGTMYELICASGPGSELFMAGVPQDEAFTIKHHHLGFLLPDQRAWDALQNEVRTGRWRMLGLNHNTGFMTRCFVAVPYLGHYLEYILPEPAGLAFLQSVPSS